jgi:hypothetical protein
MLTIRTAQMRAFADAAPNRLVVQPCRATTSWVEFRLIDAAGDPVPGECYEVRLADESLHTGRLSRDGHVRFDGIVSGTARIRFPGIDGREWGPL